MRPLYDIIDRYAVICDLAFEDADDEGQVSEAFTRLLAELEDEIQTKFEQCGFALRNMEAMEAALKSERDRLARRAQRVADKIDRLKAYLQSQLAELGQDKLQAGMFSFRVQTSGGLPTVNVLDEKSIPAPYWVQPPPVIDKRLICEASKNGETVPGVELVRGKHLRVS